MLSTALAASMAVNALMTSMIVFRIFKVTRAMPTTTSFEQTLGSTGGNKVRHIMFIIIESGMALLVTQVVRLVLGFISMGAGQWMGFRPFEDFVIVINQVLNVIIILRTVFFYISFVLLITFIWLGDRTNDNFCAGSNEDVLR